MIAKLAAQAAFAALILMAGNIPAWAQTDDVMDMGFTAGELQITGAFSRATLPGAPTAGGYMTITNMGAEEDRLVSASSDVAGMVEMHEMRMQDDVMHMSPVEEGVVIPAGESVSLSPGGLHLMFMQLAEPFKEGTMVPVMLTFDKAGSVEVLLHVGAFNADGPETMEMDSGGTDMDMNDGD